MEDAVEANPESEEKSAFDMDAEKVESLVRSSLIGAELFAPEAVSCDFPPS